jgi:outer membrane protein assembly factor BamB
VVDSVVYVGSDDGNLYALDAVTGETKWSYQTGGEVHSSPTVSYGVVYFGSNATLHAVGVEKGDLRWTYETAGKIFSTPTVGVTEAEAVVYVTSTDGALHAVHAPTGALALYYPTGGAVYSSPVLGDRLVYVASDTGVLHALDTYAKTTRNGTVVDAPQWTLKTGGAVRSSPSVVDESGDGDERTWCRIYGDLRCARLRPVVYIGSDDGKLYAVDAATGEVQWDVDLRLGAVRSLTVGGPSAAEYEEMRYHRVRDHCDDYDDEEAELKESCLSRTQFRLNWATVGGYTVFVVAGDSAAAVSRDNGQVMWTSNPDANGEYGYVGGPSSPYGYDTWGYKWDYPDGPAPRVLPAAPAVNPSPAAQRPCLDEKEPHHGRRGQCDNVDEHNNAYFVASQVNSDGLFVGEMLYSVRRRGDPDWIYSPGGMPLEIPEVSVHSSPTFAQGADPPYSGRVFFGTLDGTLHAVFFEFL